MLPIFVLFTEYLLNERHFSSYTSQAYTFDLCQFAEFIAGQSEIVIDPAREESALKERREQLEAVDGDRSALIPMSNVTAPATVTQAIIAATAETIRGYVAHLGVKQYAANSMVRKIATLRSFYKWADKRGLSDRNPMETIRTPRQQKRLPKVITIEQIEKLLATPDQPNIFGLRDRAILETIYSTGIRASELANLDLGDIDLKGESIKIGGNGRKERVVPLGSHAISALSKYAERARADPTLSQTWADTRSSRPLFFNKHGGRLGTRSVRRKLDIYLMKAGLDPTISPHTLRHSFATHLLENGANLQSIQETLGHRSANTTQVYARLVASKPKILTATAQG